MSPKLEAADTFLNFICARAKRYSNYKIVCKTKIESAVIPAYNDIYSYDEYLKQLEKLSDKFHDEMALFLIEHTSHEVRIPFLEYLFNKFNDATIPEYTYFPTSDQKELYDNELYLEIIPNQSPILHVDSTIIPKIIEQYGSLNKYHFYREYRINQLHQDFIDSTKGVIKEKIEEEKRNATLLALNEPDIIYDEPLPAFNWQSTREFNSGIIVNLLGELLDSDNEGKKPFISEITAPKFKSIFRGETKEKINFIGENAMVNALYFIYLLVIRYKKVTKEKDWQARIPNCFTINGESIPNDKKGRTTISSMLTQIGYNFAIDHPRRLLIRRKKEMDIIFNRTFGSSPTS